METRLAVGIADLLADGPARAGPCGAGAVAACCQCCPCDHARRDPAVADRTGRAQVQHDPLRDAAGAEVPIPPSTVDAQDPKQMYVAPGQLADGLYTVVWTTVSAADGHRTEGSFPFTIGASAQPAATAAAPVEQNLPGVDVAVRWFNFFALVWGVGSIAFVVLVWRPTGLAAGQAAESRLRQIMWIGWLLIGVATLLMLLAQAALTTGAGLRRRPAWLPVGMSSPIPALARCGSGARYFGSCWAYCWPRRCVARWVLWAALAAGAALLALTSLFSHAGAAATVRRRSWPIGSTC